MQAWHSLCWYYIRLRQTGRARCIAERALRLPGATLNNESVNVVDFLRGTVALVEGNLTEATLQFTKLNDVSTFRYASLFGELLCEKSKSRPSKDKIKKIEQSLPDERRASSVVGTYCAAHLLSILGYYDLASSMLKKTSLSSTDTTSTLFMTTAALWVELDCCDSSPDGKQQNAALESASKVVEQLLTLTSGTSMTGDLILSLTRYYIGKRSFTEAVDLLRAKGLQQLPDSEIDLPLENYTKGDKTACFCMVKVENVRVVILNELLACHLMNGDWDDCHSLIEELYCLEPTNVSLWRSIFMLMALAPMACNFSKLKKILQPSLQQISFINFALEKWFECLFDDEKSSFALLILSLKQVLNVTLPTHTKMVEKISKYAEAALQSYTTTLSLHDGSLTSPLERAPHYRGSLSILCAQVKLFGKSIDEAMVWLSKATDVASTRTLSLFLMAEAQTMFVDQFSIEDVQTQIDFLSGSSESVSSNPLALVADDHRPTSPLVSLLKIKLALSGVDSNDSNEEAFNFETTIDKLQKVVATLIVQLRFSSFSFFFARLNANLFANIAISFLEAKNKNNAMPGPSLIDKNQIRDKSNANSSKVQERMHAVAQGNATCLLRAQRVLELVTKHFPGASQCIAILGSVLIERGDHLMAYDLLQSFQVPTALKILSSTVNTTTNSNSTNNILSVNHNNEELKMDQDVGAISNLFFVTWGRAHYLSFNDVSLTITQIIDKYPFIKHLPFSVYLLALQAQVLQKKTEDLIAILEKLFNVSLGTVKIECENNFVSRFTFLWLTAAEVSEAASLFLNLMHSSVEQVVDEALVGFSNSEDRKSLSDRIVSQIYKNIEEKRQNNGTCMTTPSSFDALEQQQLKQQQQQQQSTNNNVVTSQNINDFDEECAMHMHDEKVKEAIGIADKMAALLHVLQKLLKQTPHAHQVTILQARLLCTRDKPHLALSMLQSVPVGDFNYFNAQSIIARLYFVTFNKPRNALRVIENCAQNMPTPKILMALGDARLNFASDAKGAAEAFAKASELAQNNEELTRRSLFCLAMAAQHEPTNVKNVHHLYLNALGGTVMPLLSSRVFLGMDFAEFLIYSGKHVNACPTLLRLLKLWYQFCLQLQQQQNSSPPVLTAEAIDALESFYQEQEQQQQYQSEDTNFQENSKLQFNFGNVPSISFAKRCLSWICEMLRHVHLFSPQHSNQKSSDTLQTNTDQALNALNVALLCLSPVLNNNASVVNDDENVSNLMIGSHLCQQSATICNDFSGALKFASKALKQNPNDLDGCLLLAHLYELDHNLAQREATLATALKIAPNSSHAASRLLQLRVFAGTDPRLSSEQRHQALSAAIRLAQSTLLKDPTNWTVLALFLTLLRFDCRLSTGERLIKEAERTVPNVLSDAGFRYCRATHLEGMGQFSDALIDLKAAMTTPSWRIKTLDKAVDLLLQVAPLIRSAVQETNFLVSKSNFDSDLCVQYIHALFSATPQHVLKTVTLAWAEIASRDVKRIQQARASLNLAVGHTSESSTTVLVALMTPMLVCQKLLGIHSDIDSLSKLIEKVSFIEHKMKREMERAHLFLAESYYALHKPTQALKHAEQARILNPALVRAQELCGMLLEKEADNNTNNNNNTNDNNTNSSSSVSRSAEAAEAYEVVWELSNKTDSKTAVKLAKCLLKSNRPVDALSLCDLATNAGSYEKDKKEIINQARLLIRP